MAETYVDTRRSLSGGRVRPEELLIDTMRNINFDVGIEKRQNDAFTGDMIRPVAAQQISKDFFLESLHTSFPNSRTRVSALRCPSIQRRRRRLGSV